MSIIIRIGTLLLNILYTFFKLLPQGKRIVFISRQSNTPSLDSTVLKKQFNRMHPDYKVIMLFHILPSDIAGKIRYCFHMLRQMYHMARAEVVILDSYCILASILKHRENLLIIQMWHSIGTMKKFGYSILDKPEGSSSKIAKLMKMHKNYDYILCAGDGYRTHLAEGFGYPLRQIVTLPLPRVEVLKSRSYSDKVRNRIFKKYPELETKKNIVYVPTFRKSNDSALITAMEELCRSIDYSKYNLIIKAHPLTDVSSIKDSPAMIDHDFTSFDMLFVSDIVVTDYSCIMYEAAVLKKPLYFYTYDYEEYMESRDIYMDYKEEVPGPICDTASALFDAIQRETYDYGKLSSFLNKYVSTGSSSESADIVNFIFEKKES